MKKLTVSLRRSEIIAGFIFMVMQILVLPFLLVLCNELLPHPMSEVELNFASFALNFIGVTVIFHRFLIDSAKAFLRSPGNNLLICLGGFGLYWFSSIAVNGLVLFLEPEFSNVNDDSIQLLTQQSMVLMTVSTVLLVPVTEECLYRGLLFGLLYRKNAILGYVVSVAVFSALHVISYIGMYDPFRLFLCFLQYLPASISLAWTYTQADSIWAPVLIHTLVNLIGMLAIQ